jgi:hypothetical protein
MGNNMSIPSNTTNTSDNENTNKKPKLPQMIDHIATDLITKQTFQDMNNLHDGEYCKKIIVLTKNVIRRYLNNLEIDFLHQRMKKGVKIDKITPENIKYMLKDDLESLDEIVNLKKKRMCNEIAKFYVKIAHLFAAISKAVNPVLTYKDKDGNTVIAPLENRKELSKNIKVSISKLGLCSRRIYAIMANKTQDGKIIAQLNNCNLNENLEIYTKKTQNEKTKESNTSENKMNVGTQTQIQQPNINQQQKPSQIVNENPQNQQPNIRDANVVNLDQVNNVSAQSGGGKTDVRNLKTLFDEPGIPELENLYFGEFKQNGVLKSRDIMTRLEIEQYEAAKIQYRKDLAIFYRVFTGKELTDDIKSFKQIPLRDFHNRRICNDDKLSHDWKRKYIGSISSKLFAAYADHLADMISRSEENENALISIINELFSYWVEPTKKKKTLTINPNLTNEKLQKLIEKTRKIIIKLYITCERDFQTAVKLFEGIVLSRHDENVKIRSKIQKKNIGNNYIDQLINKQKS